MTFRELEQFVKRHHISVDTPIAVFPYDGSDYVEAETITLDKVLLTLGEEPQICIIIE